jgi:hypothetical protein
MLKKIPAITFFTCALAILFPPWGWGSRKEFEGFYFLLSNNVPHPNPKYSTLTLDISWELLFAELTIIIFIGFGSYFFLKKK